MSVSIGIDFGTSTTLVAVRSDDKSLPTTVVVGKNSNPWMPSVAATVDGKVVVGEEALDQAPSKVIRSVKSALTKKVPTVGVDSVDPRDVVRLIVEEVLHRAATSFPGLRDSLNVFLGCPAQWDGRQRRQIADIAAEIGLNVDVGEIIDEPVAAGLAWVEEAWRDGPKPKGKVLIFDAGGGTLDVAVLEVSETDSGSHRVAVLAADSIAESGDAIDLRIANEIVRRTSLQNIPSHRAEQDLLLLDSSRQIKESLSTSEDIIATVRSSFTAETPEIAFSMEELEKLVEPQVKRSLELVHAALVVSKYRGRPPLSPGKARSIPLSELSDEIDHVVLVGGMSKLRTFSQRLEKQFNMAQLHHVSNPQELVALGLTYGDRLQSLNLPRPPVDFIISTSPHEETIYEAFTPLYNWSDPIRKDVLSLRCDVPEFGHQKNVFLRCVSPTRGKKELDLLIAIKHNEDFDLGTYMWWDPNGDWKSVRPEDVTNEIDFLAEIDARHEGDDEDQPTGFVDAITYRRQLAESKHKTTYIRGRRIYLGDEFSSGVVVFYVDGTVLLNGDTRRLLANGKTLKMQILYWPLQTRRY